MDSNVQIVSHVCTVCAEVQLAAASSTNRGVHVHTRAPVILAWRVLRGARRHTSGKGGAKPHPRERWGTSTTRGETPHPSHTHGKGGTQPHPRERWGTSTEGRDATPKAKAMGEVGDLDESTALTWQLTAKRPSRGACARTPAARRAAGRTRLARYAAHWSAGGTAVPACQVALAPC